MSCNHAPSPSHTIHRRRGKCLGASVLTVSLTHSHTHQHSVLCRATGRSPVAILPGNRLTHTLSLWQHRVEKASERLGEVACLLILSFCVFCNCALVLVCGSFVFRSFVFCSRHCRLPFCCCSSELAVHAHSHRRARQTLWEGGAVAVVHSSSSGTSTAGA